MKNIWKKTAVITSFAILATLLSLSCRQSKTYHFVWDSIILNNVESYYGDVMLQYKYVDDQEGFASKTYGFEALIKSEYYTAAMNYFDFSFSLIPEAKAFQGPFNDYILKDGVVDVKIKTVNDFNPSRKAGSDVTDYFKVYIYNELKPVEDLIWRLNRNYREEMLRYEGYVLLLREDPYFGVKQQFEMQIILESGKTIVQKSSEIVITGQK